MFTLTLILFQIRPKEHELKQNPFFQEILYLTLTFDLLTLTFYKIVVLIDDDPHSNVGSNLTYSTKFITKTIFSGNINLTLTFDPMTLTF